MLQRVLTFLSLCLMLSIGAHAQRNCETMSHLQSEILQDPQRQEILDQIEKHTQQFSTKADRGALSVITIPVVFHVVHRTSTENIDQNQLLSQLQVLNDDFRRLNADANGAWPQAADTEIEFCLATVDPAGNPTSGITRTQTSVNGFGTNDAMKFGTSGGQDAWPRADYLNFWVCNIGGGILGYAQFPGGPASTDGVVCDYRYVGTTGTATAPFDLGRTATHEVGHWLNLRHIWGDGPCGSDDLVADTPLSDAPNYQCAQGHVSCGSSDMVANYMDYSDDACMNLYTLGQKTRMQAVLAPGGFRASLAASGGCGTPAPSTCSDGVQNGDETGVDCGGSTCAPCSGDCSGTTVSITITLDDYPEETSWALLNDGGATVASGGTYGTEPDGSTITVDECLQQGCYTFTISDVYGDGICCTYGNGSYSVSDGSGVLAAGGSFGSAETTTFCVGGQTTSCTDGIQNGSETGIDCGGPDCATCPTCSDGLQNGNETGVDCGGPDCAACPTCSDNTQNGNETGVDCGGPDCAACPTCTDGILNGNETEVDCGGSDCAPCSATCPLYEIGIAITLDNYPGETTWTLADDQGQVIGSGGPYGNEPNGSTVTDTICLDDGCYTFVINDTYGDGICCSYGNGSYSIINGGTVVATGGAFGSVETTAFCLGNTSSCSDGIQNGQETSIDCGGPDCNPCGGGSSELFGHYFEAGFDGWTDGGGDCARLNSANSYEGNYSIRLRDNSGTASSMTSPVYDITPYATLSLSFHFYAFSMEVGEDFFVEYYDGTTWATIGNYTSGFDFANNTFYQVAIPLNAADVNFSTQSQWRLRCDASGNQDQIFIDAITLTSAAVTRSAQGNIEALHKPEPIEHPTGKALSATAYPNPAADAVTISANVNIDKIDIRSLTGHLVHTQHGTIDQDHAEIDLSSLSSGLYIVTIYSRQEVQSIKLMKQ